MTDFSGKMVFNLFYFQIKIKLSIKSAILHINLWNISFQEFCLFKNNINKIYLGHSFNVL